MIQSATFSMEESENILKTFLVDYDLSKVIQKFVKREPIHLREHLKRIIRETIINIQAHLFKAQKIPSLLLYDNQSDQMFEAFINLKDIIPQTEKDNFYLNFVNMKSQGCRILRFGRTDYHVSINSEQRQRIYARFISYTEHHSLYKYAITRKDQDCNVQTPPYSDPSKLFSPRDLEFVFKTYCMYKGDIVKMAQFFKQKGVDDPRFQIESLQLSIPNLMLIGYYIAHKRSAEGNNIQPIRWAQFRDKYPLPQQCDFKAKVIWIRIAIRDDPEQSELKWIQRIQKKKVIINTKQKRPQLPKKGPNIDHKKWRKGKQCVLSKIKQQLKQTIVNPNLEEISEINSVDGQSVKSFRSKPSQLKQKSQKVAPLPPAQNLKFMPLQQQQDEQDDYFEERLSKKQMQPEFLKKIHKQSQRQKVILQKDEKEVVWQEIPEKSSSVNPDDQQVMSVTPSVKFYSQKPNYDKPSKQLSVRSAKKTVRPKQIAYKQKKKNQIYEEQEEERIDQQNYEDYEVQGEMDDQDSEEQSQSD